MAIAGGLKSAEAGTSERVQAEYVQYASKPAFDEFRKQNPSLTEDDAKARFAKLPPDQRQQLLQIGLGTRVGFAYEKAVNYLSKNLQDLVSVQKPAMLDFALSEQFQKYAQSFYERDKKAEGIHEEDLQLLQLYGAHRSTKSILATLEKNKKENNPLKGLDEEQQKQLSALAVYGAVKNAEEAFKKSTPERKQLAMQLAEKVAQFMPGYDLYKNSVGKIEKDQKAQLEKAGGKEYEDKVVGVVSKTLGYGIMSGNPDRERNALDLYSVGVGYQPGRDFSKLYPAKKKEKK